MVTKIEETIFIEERWNYEKGEYISYNYVETVNHALKDIKFLLSRIKELEEGIEKHCKDNKISSLEHDGTYSTTKCRGWKELYKLVEEVAMQNIIRGGR
jgi:hypothetical protein